MKIILNGTVWVNDEELYFDGLEAEFDNNETEGLDVPFFDEDDFDDECEYCDGTCDDCEFEEDDEDYLDPLEKLIEEYAEVLSEECICPDCVRGILANFVYDLIKDE